MAVIGGHRLYWAPPAFTQWFSSRESINSRFSVVFRTINELSGATRAKAPSGKGTPIDSKTSRSEAEASAGDALRTESSASGGTMYCLVIRGVGGSAAMVMEPVTRQHATISAKIEKSLQRRPDVTRRSSVQARAMMRFSFLWTALLDVQFELLCGFFIGSFGLGFVVSRYAVFPRCSLSNDQLTNIPTKAK